MVLIVGWHTKVLGQATFYIYPTDINLTGFLYFSVFLLGVPLFFAISQFLYIKNRREGYFLKRLLTLAVFLIFWNIVAFGLFANQLTALDWVSHGFIIRGGYGPLYFIFDLIIITIITESICLCYERFESKNFIFIMYLALCITLVFSFLTPFALRPDSFLNQYLLSFQSFMNFLPYAIAGFIISEKTKKNKMNNKPIIKFVSLKYTAAFIFCVLISFLEYFIYKKYLPALFFDQVYPFYNRIGLFISAMTIFYLFLGFQKPINKYLGLLAGLTGGVFVIHYIIINTLQSRFPNWYAVNIQHSVLFLLAVLIFSYLLSWILKMKRII